MHKHDVTIHSRWTKVLSARRQVRYRTHSKLWGNIYTNVEDAEILVVVVVEDNHTIHRVQSESMRDRIRLQALSKR